MVYRLFVNASRYCLNLRFYTSHLDDQSHCIDNAMVSKKYSRSASSLSRRQYLSSSYPSFSLFSSRLIRATALLQIIDMDTPWLKIHASHIPLGNLTSPFTAPQRSDHPISELPAIGPNASNQAKSSHATAPFPPKEATPSPQAWRPLISQASLPG